jgi:hypothetical protein
LHTHHAQNQPQPGKTALVNLCQRFQKRLPVMLKNLQLKESEIPFVDRSKLIGIWLETAAKA